MSVTENKAADVKGPFSDGTNNSTVRAYTAPTTAKMTEVPEIFEGGFVTMLAMGADVYWFWSFQNTVGPSGSVSPDDNGAAGPQTGFPLLNGQAADVLCPKRQLPSGRVYFCRVSSSDTASVWMRQSSS